MTNTISLINQNLRAILPRVLCVWIWNCVFTVNSSSKNSPKCMECKNVSAILIQWIQCQADIQAVKALKLAWVHACSVLPGT